MPKWNTFFEDVFKYLNGEYVWDCTKKKIDSFTISPGGYIYWCKKMNLVSDIKFIDIDKSQYKNYMEKYNVMAKKCVINCYSNCGYNFYYFRKHQLMYLKSIISIYIRRR